MDLEEGTSPKIALGLGSDEQDLSPYLVRLRLIRPYLQKWWWTMTSSSCALPC